MGQPGASSSQWLFPRSALLATPSATTSTMPLSNELYDRARGVEFLYRLGSSLYLPNSALFTAATWFHRFYMRYSLEDYHRQDVAAACVFLATKTEECGRKLRDIAKVYRSKVSAQPMENISQEEIDRCQVGIIAAEEMLLEALCFDFVVSSPHEILVDLFDRHDPDIRELALRDVAWCIAHDSFRTVLCILFDIRIIAAACFIFAQRLLDGPNSASLDARIASSAASASLPTPPTNKPTTPDATRFVVSEFQFNEAELNEVAESLCILIEFYGAQDTTSAFSYVETISSVPLPLISKTREQLYAPRSHAPTAATQSSNGTQPFRTSTSSQRTPESTHGGYSPAKGSSHGWIPVRGEAGHDAAGAGNVTRARPDPS